MQAKFGSDTSSVQRKPFSRFMLSGKWGWLIIAATVLFVIISFPTISNSYSSYGYNVVNGKETHIVAAPGETVPIRFPLENNVGGNWASTGVNFVLSLPGSSLTLPVLAPKDPDWGNTVAVSDNGFHGQTLIVYGLLTFPTALSVPANNTLRGEFRGQIPYPEYNDGNFRNTAETYYDAPAVISFVPSPVIWQKSGRLSFYLFAVLDILLILSVLFWLSRLIITDRARTIIAVSSLLLLLVYGIFMIVMCISSLAPFFQRQRMDLFLLELLLLLSVGFDLVMAMRIRSNRFN